MILISNVYYMLAYAFRSLNSGGIGEISNEQFVNIHELFAEIIVRGMRRQLKRGLPKIYRNESEELSNLRGKIGIQSSIRNMTQVRHHLVCEFDEFTEDTESNRVIKCAITHLLRQNDVSLERKRLLKFLHSNLSGIAEITYRTILPQRSGGADYVMLVNICIFLLDGLLMNTSGGHKMREWLPDEKMSALYEHFLLAFFKQHYPHYNARAARIEWDADVISPHMPGMQSDVYLTHREKTLIIDAKFYKSTMLEYSGKRIYHSNNLYQIYTYVKNADKAKSGNVSGMLLYAKTDEAVTPDSDSIIGGNKISVKTLDLSHPFLGIKMQLDKVAGILA